MESANIGRMNAPTLLFFAAYPAAESLGFAAGGADAARLAEALLLDGMARSGAVAAARGWRRVLCFEPLAAREAFRALLAREGWTDAWTLLPQAEGARSHRWRCAQQLAALKGWGPVGYASVATLCVPAAELTRGMELAEGQSTFLVSSSAGEPAWLALAAGVPAKVFEHASWSGEAGAGDPFHHLVRCHLRAVKGPACEALRSEADLKALHARLRADGGEAPRTKAVLDAVRGV